MPCGPVRGIGTPGKHTGVGGTQLFQHRQRVRPEHVVAVRVGLKNLLPPVGRVGLQGDREAVLPSQIAILRHGGPVLHPGVGVDPDVDLVSGKQLGQ